MIVRARSGALPLSERQGVWPRAVAHIADDPWAAPFVAHHAVFVYDRFRESPDWQAFFEQMTVTRDALLQQVERLSFDDLRRDYTFVRLGDLASLTFCCGWTDTQQFAGYTIRLQGTRLLISPDPFERREIPIEIATRELPDRRYNSAADAAQAYRAARRAMLRGTVAGNGA